VGAVITTALTPSRLHVGCGALHPKSIPVYYAA